MRVERVCREVRCQHPALSIDDVGAGAADLGCRGFGARLGRLRRGERAHPQADKREAGKEEDREHDNPALGTLAVAVADALVPQPSVLRSIASGFSPRDRAMMIRASGLRGVRVTVRLQPDELDRQQRRLRGIDGKRHLVHPCELLRQERQESETVIVQLGQIAKPVRPRQPGPFRREDGAALAQPTDLAL